MDGKILRGMISESGIKKVSLANKLGLSRTALDNKLNEKTEFKLSEIEALSNILGLSSEEITAIFFTKKVD